MMPIADFETTIMPLSESVFTEDSICLSVPSVFTGFMSISRNPFNEPLMRSSVSRKEESLTDFSEWRTSHTAVGCQVLICPTTKKTDTNDGSIGSSLTGKR